MYSLYCVELLLYGKHFTCDVKRFPSNYTSTELEVASYGLYWVKKLFYKSNLSSNLKLCLAFCKAKLSINLTLCLAVQIACNCKYMYPVLVCVYGMAGNNDLFHVEIRYPYQVDICGHFGPAAIPVVMTVRVRDKAIFLFMSHVIVSHNTQSSPQTWLLETVSDYFSQRNMDDLEQDCSNSSLTLSSYFDLMFSWSLIVRDLFTIFHISFVIYLLYILYCWLGGEKAVIIGKTAVIL